MTITNENRKISYDIDDTSEFTFAYTFDIIDVATVFLSFFDTNGDDVIVVMTRTSSSSPSANEYFVDEDNNRIVIGGSGTLQTQYLDTITQLLITRTVAITQESAFPTVTSLQTTAIENSLDNNVMSMQQIGEEVDRCLKIPIQDDVAAITELDSAANRAGKFQGYDGDGDPVLLSGTTGVSVTAYMETVLGAADADAAMTTLSGIPIFNVKTFGAVGDGVTDDSAATQAALTAAGAATNGGTVFFPPGVYLFATGLIKPSGINIKGVGIGENKDKITQLVYSGTGNAITCSYTENDVDQSTISDFDMLCTSTADAGIFVENAQQLRIHDVQVDNWTNNGNYGIHIAGGSHFMQIVDSQVWGRVYGIFSEVSDTGDFLRNNATQFTRCNVLGDTAFIFMDGINGAVIDQVEVNQTIDPSAANIVLNDTNYCAITAGYFENANAQTSPFILLSGTASHSRISDNTLILSNDHTIAAINLDGTGGFSNLISGNAFIGGSGVVIVNFDMSTGTNFDFFQGNTIKRPLLVNGKPNVTGSGNFFLESNNWFSGIFLEIDTLANSATPSVKNKNIWITGGTTTITNLLDGVVGQTVTLMAEHSLIITDGTNMFLNGSANFSMTDTDTLTLIQKADGKWYEISRGDNGA